MEAGLAPRLAGALLNSPILCLNGGSSSLKFALYRLGGKAAGGEELLAEGAVERLGLPGARLWARRPGEAEPVEHAGPFPDHHAAVGAVFDVLEGFGLPSSAAVGHRLVHGGPAHVAPERVDARLLDRLRELIPLAPLHLPSEIAVIEAVAARFTDLPQVVCFDTAFHRPMPELAQRLPLSEDLWDKGVRRYGFHGLSYEFILDALGVAGSGRLIVAHLGNGASLAAIRDGQPRETTMGFTPTGGLMMGTRSGDLDPGVLVYLASREGYDAPRLERLVNLEAGLLGVSGTSPDMKTLLAVRAAGPPGRPGGADVLLPRAEAHRGAGRRPGGLWTRWSSPAASGSAPRRSAGRCATGSNTWGSGSTPDATMPTPIRSARRGARARSG